MSSGNSPLDGVPTSGELSFGIAENLTRRCSVSAADRVRDNVPSRDYDGLKSQCDKAMHELQVLRRQHTETVRRCEHTMKELEYYRGQHHAAMAQLESAAQESSSLRTKYGELVSDLRSSQEGENGNAEMNQLYLTTLSKYETIKEEYESVRKRYEDLIASHSSAVDKLELAQEEVGRIKKQCEEMVNERNLALRERNGLKQQCTAAIRQWDIALRERNEYQDALVKLQQQHEEAVKEINQAMAVRMKASKDLKRLTEERNAAMQEYSLIMSERDTVHKEMEKLTEDLSQACKKNKILEAESKQIAEEKKALAYQVETLKREIASALLDRDKALKECHDLRQRGGEYKERNPGETKTRFDSSHRERDPGRKDPREVQSGSMDLFEKCQKERMDNLDQANQEIDKLNKQIDKLQAELGEAFQEAEVCKRRRDWAFSERDKIVMERESIRTLCDRLRKERDRAVSDLAEALRDSDDISKQRAETSKQLKVLKEKMEAQLEKENRIAQLHSSLGHNYSHDSAIDTDMQECDSEMLSIDINGLSSTEDLGVELAGGRDDPHYPNDTGIYVTSITKGSVADGKLKPNDCIVRVNNVDCSNVSKRFVLETMKSSGNTAVMVVRRRRLFTIQLQLSKYDHGLSLESGIYISKISPGSLAAKDGNLAVGDRVVSINNRTVEGLMSAREAMSLLNEISDTLLITTLKTGSIAVPCRQSNTSTQTSLAGPLPMIERVSSSDDYEAAPAPKPSRKIGAGSSKWSREPTEEKKRTVNPPSSPITFEQETDDALAELDNVIDTYHTAKNVERRRHKHNDYSGGTWPKARNGPSIEPGTGTIVHPRKVKERPPLSVILNNRPGYPYQEYYEPDSQNPPSLDFSVRSARKTKTRVRKERKSSGNMGKEVLEYYVKMKPRADGQMSGGASSPVSGGLTSEVHSRIHSQLYLAPHFSPPSFVHPHTHSHPAPPPPPSYHLTSESGRSPSLSPTTVYRPKYIHAMSPSVDSSHYGRSRTLNPHHSASHHTGGHASDDGGDSTPSYNPSQYDVAATLRKKEDQRFRIPSNPSVISGRVSSGSIEKASERESPMPYYVEVLSPGLGRSQCQTASLPDYYLSKPSPGQLRRVHIEKTAEPLGIQINCLDSGGVFVSTVSENSLASRVGIRIGDQLLEVCGINMRSATYELAASVLRQCGNSITMLVQYSPDKYHELEGTGSSSSGDSKTRSGSPTPCNSPGIHRKSPLSRHLSPLSISHSSSLPGDEPRYLRIETHKSSDLGISLLGGNAVGIYVHSVQNGSLAYNSGLRTGDRILEYNGTDLRAATAEGAAYELAKPADKVIVLAQYSIDRYNEIKDKPGDSLYIRALFDRVGEMSDDVQLRFRKDDILYVDNTMFNGVPGSWRAYLVDEEGRCQQGGIIPSKVKVEEEMVVRRSLSGELDGDARRATRRSFFRRKRHQRSDSRELASFSNISLGWYSDSGMLNEETSLNSYQRVTMLNCPTPRPVLVVGPLSDCVTEKLMQDFPDKFARCGPDMMHCPQAIMEKKVADSVFVDFRKKGNFFECTSVSAIKDICDKSLHPILEVSLASVERLHRHQIYPIVLLIKFKSTKQIKEVKDTRYPLDKVTAKAAKEMYEIALKLEQEYKHVISAIIPAAGVNIAYMCALIKSAVDAEQNKTLWVPCSTQCIGF